MIIGGIFLRLCQIWSLKTPPHPLGVDTSMEKISYPRSLYLRTLLRTSTGNLEFMKTVFTLSPDSLLSMGYKPLKIVSNLVFKTPPHPLGFDTPMEKISYPESIPTYPTENIHW